MCPECFTRPTFNFDGLCTFNKLKLWCKNLIFFLYIELKFKHNTPK